MNKEERFPAQKPDPNNIIIGFDDYEIHGLFLNPVYIVKRSSTTINEEEEDKDIEDIIAEGMRPNSTNQVPSKNTHIFDTKLNNLKEFCYTHILKYVDALIQPKNYLEFYITQSWLNVAKPGGFHPQHMHGNSIISGIYYFKMEESDGVAFFDPNWKIKQAIRIASQDGESPNNRIYVHQNADPHHLLLFPSWLEHGVFPNPKATTDRISLSFNVFVKGVIEDESEYLRDLTLL